MRRGRDTVDRERGHGTFMRPGPISLTRKITKKRGLEHGIGPVKEHHKGRKIKKQLRIETRLGEGKGGESSESRMGFSGDEQGSVKQRGQETITFQ